MISSSGYEDYREAAHGRWRDMVEEIMSERKMAGEKKPVVTTSFIQGVAEELKVTLAGKNEDYAPGDEFSNFEQAADFAGVDTFHLIMGQIGIKLTRIENLHKNAFLPNNESLRDSLVDLAGYSVIAAAWLDAVQAEQAADFPRFNEPLKAYDE